MKLLIVFSILFTFLLGCETYDANVDKGKNINTTVDKRKNSTHLFPKDSVEISDSLKQQKRLKQQENFKLERQDSLKRQQLLNQFYQTNLENQKLKRVEFAEVMRNGFLDIGLNIYVNVTGKNKDRLILTYSLMSDVWVHHLRKNYEDIIISLGFVRVDFKDNWDYHKYVIF